MSVSSLDQYLSLFGIDQANFTWFYEGMSVDEISANLNKQITEILTSASHNPDIQQEVLWLGIVQGLLSVPESVIKLLPEVEMLPSKNILEAFHTSMTIALNAMDPKNSLIKDLNESLAKIFSRGLTKKATQRNPEGFSYFVFNRMNIIASKLEMNMCLAHRATKAAGAEHAFAMRKEIEQDLMAIVQIFEWLGIKQPTFIAQARKAITENPAGYIKAMEMRTVLDLDKIPLGKKINVQTETGDIEAISAGKKF